MNKKALVVVPQKEHNEQKTMKQCSVELYTVSESYDFGTVYQNIKTYCEKHKASYVAMLHDSDYYTENTFDSRKQLIGTKGQKKRDHYHVLVSFAYRVTLSDFALAIGIEDRWIKCLTHEYDFDNMIVYLTHIKYDPAVKHHYPVENFETNIFDYCRFIYDQTVEKMENEKNNPVEYARKLLESVAHKMRMVDLVTAMLEDYDLNVINKYYRILKDYVFEHNQTVDTASVSEILEDKIKCQMKQEKMSDDERIKSLVDAFGCTDIEIAGDVFTVVRKRKE